MTIKRTDSNQQEIMDALRAFGYSVFDTHMVGKGFPDLVIAIGGRNILVEVKSPKGRFTKAEMDFKDNWKGMVVTVTSIDNAKLLHCYIPELSKRKGNAIPD